MDVRHWGSAPAWEGARVETANVRYGFIVWGVQEGMHRTVKGGEGERGSSPRSDREVLRGSDVLRMRSKSAMSMMRAIGSKVGG